MLTKKETGQKIVIWGSGNAFKENIHWIRSRFAILCGVDSNERNRGVIDGVRFCSPDVLKDVRPDFVLVVVKWPFYREQIAAEISQISPEMIIKYPEEFRTRSVKWSEQKGPYSETDDLGNTIFVAEGSFLTNFRITFNGMENRIDIGQGVKSGDYCKIRMEGDHNRMIIGDSSTILGMEAFISEAGTVTLGCDCMLSTGIVFYQEQSHVIFDRESGKRTNGSKNIVLHDHVWLGRNVTCLAGAEIGEGSVVGYGSVVSKRYGDHQVIAGNPGRVVRENADWERELAHEDGSGENS